MGHVMNQEKNEHKENPPNTVYCGTRHQPVARPVAPSIMQQLFIPLLSHTRFTVTAISLKATPPPPPDPHELQRTRTDLLPTLVRIASEFDAYYIDFLGLFTSKLANGEASYKLASWTIHPILT
jgi:hypothetical protein